MKKVIVKKSKIHGKGVFAAKDFKEGETVLAWKPKRISEGQLSKLPKEQKKYIAFSNGWYFLMQPPEKYVNYSCEANTLMGKKCDIAKRNIRQGEEITSDYKDSIFDNFKCNCGSKDCKNKKRKLFSGK
ncbi:MAG: hypothetical protein NTZ97_01850 [Candidatus Moranbacteria bacterium]|nr:hypothetical protein [Candidatus Moranbacteria bacterium]